MLRNFMWNVVKTYVAGDLPESATDPEQSIPHPELNDRLDLLMRLSCNAYFVGTEYDVFDTVREGRCW
jgi:hypothetical protein